MRLKHIAVGAMAVAGVAWFAMPGASSPSSRQRSGCPATRTNEGGPDNTQGATAATYINTV